MESKSLFESPQFFFDIIKEEQRHFRVSDAIQIINVISGEVTIEHNGSTTKNRPGALRIIAPFDVIFCDSRFGAFILLSIPNDYLVNHDVPPFFPIQTGTTNNFPGLKQEFDVLRKDIANLWNVYFSQDQKNNQMANEKILLLLFHLREYFSDGISDTNPIDNTDYRSRLKNIIDYVHDHWNEEFRISDIAAREYISPNYLSYFWHKCMGCTLSKYISDIRLEYAKKELHGNRSLSEISTFCGFSTLNTFNRKFAEAFGISPREYRAKFKQNDSINHMPFLHSDSVDLSILLPYMDSNSSDPIMQKQLLKINFQAETTPMSLSWRKLINIGFARDGLNSLVQLQLQRAQKEIGFEYLRFHGIFDDDMHIYNESSDGSIQLSFFYTDALIDFIISIGLKPYIEFSYTPKALAKKLVREIDRESYFSKINNLEKWRELIRRFLEHAIMRYGEANVRQWRFTIAGGEMTLYSYLTDEEYFEQYEVSFHAVKSVCKDLQFGGFGSHTYQIVENGNFEWLLKQSIKKNCLPDFICLQNFPIQYEKENPILNPVLQKLRSISPVTISPNIHHSTALLHHTKEILSHYQLQDKEIWFEEWSSSIWQRDVANDTCYKAAWIIKEISENFNNVNAFGYWLLTDIIEEMPSADSIYFGGWGLFARTGIPKAGWNALKLLKKLGNDYIASGEGYFVTKQDNAIQILLFHYIHYNDVYRFCNQTPVDARMAYNIYLHKNDCHFHITLQNCPLRKYRIEKRILNQEYGSSYDKWMTMGMPNYLHQSEVSELEAVSGMQLTVNTHASTDGILTVETTLQPHACELYIISFC